MPKPPTPQAPAPTPAAPSLAEQHAEFTAEGSPPPGHVAAGRPVGGTAAAPPAPAEAVPPARPKIKLKRATRARYP